MCVIRCSGCVLFWMGMAHNFGFNMNYYHWATFLVKSIGWLRLLWNAKQKYFIFYVVTTNLALVVAVRGENVANTRLIFQVALKVTDVLIA